MLEFMYPLWFWAFLLIPAYLVFEYFVKRKRTPRLSYSRVAILKQAAGHSSLMEYLPMILRSLVIILLIIALARPRISNKLEKVTGEGIDIVVAIDISGSMQAIDFQPTNRLEAAKKVAADFVSKRVNDKIGFVTFSETAYTQAPLTLDYNILMSLTETISIDEGSSGTAIGMGLAMATARLKDSEAETKIIILLTDGQNNAGEIDPFTAADLAKRYGIKVYTIGVGQKGLVDFPVQDPYTGRTIYRKMQSDVDMETLNRIAQLTGTESAKRAHNTEELQTIFDYIDKQEKTAYVLEHYYQYDEKFYVFLLAAVIVLLFEFLYRIYFRKEIP